MHESLRIEMGLIDPIYNGVEETRKKYLPDRPHDRELLNEALKIAFTHATGQLLANRPLPFEQPNVLDSLPEAMIVGYPTLHSAVQGAFPEEDTARHSINIADVDGGVFPLYASEFALGTAKSILRIFGNSSMQSIIQSILTRGKSLDEKLLDIAGIEAINQLTAKNQDAFIAVSKSWSWIPRQPWLEKFFIQNGFLGYAYGLDRTKPKERTNPDSWYKLSRLMDQAIEKLDLKRWNVVDINLFVDVYHPLAPAADREGGEGQFLRWAESELQKRGFQTRAHYRLINPFFKPGAVLDTKTQRFVPSNDEE